MIRLRFRTTLRTSVDKVWAQVSTMDGVNQELGPWVRMTAPATFRRRSLQEATPTQLQGVLFHSVLLAFGCLPFDVHALHLSSVTPGTGFSEHSTSWMHKIWIHRRHLQPTAEGCIVTDDLAIEPRLILMTPVVRLVVGFLFRHRHRRLLAGFGAG